MANKNTKPSKQTKAKEKTDKKAILKDIAKNPGKPVLG